MRVSDGMLYKMNQMLLDRQRTNIGEKQLIASSGLRVSAPSDDPLAIARARRHTARIERAETTMKTSDNSVSRLQAAEGALNEVTALLARVKELTVAAASDTNSATERQAMAVEVQQIREQLIALANTELGNQYVFAGFSDTTPPFDPAGAFQGDANVREVELTPGNRLKTHVNAGDVFGGNGGALDVMQLLDDVVTAMNANDEVNIRASLDTLDTARDQVLDGRQKLGAYMQSFEVARSIAERAREISTIARSDLLDADAFQSANDLVQAERALQAAVSVASRLPLPGLVQKG